MVHKAAEQGHAEAQLNLALMYDMNDDIERDAEKAVYWYNKAAVQDSL